MSAERYYLLVGVVIIFVGLGTTGLFNLLVDPYALYQLIERKEFDHNMSHNAPWRLETAYRIRRKRAHTLIMGSSRAISGLPADEKNWGSANLDPINIALPGANMREINAYFKHAHTIQPLSQVVLGLDFFSFNVFSPDREDFNLQRLATASFLAQIFAFIRDTVSTLLTWDVLVASRDALLDTKKKHHDEGSNSKPYRQVFKTMERAYMRGLWFPCPTPKFSLVPDDKQINQLHQFREIVSIAKKEGIDLHLFISPIHARLHEALYQLGLWGEYERWKRKLVNLVVIENNANPNGARLKIWDFSTYNAYTTEKVPIEGDLSTQMDWYLDSAHYTPKFGHLVLTEMFGNRDENAQRIGRVINLGDVDNHLDNLRQARERYAQSHPEDVAEIAKQVAETQDYRSQKQCRLH